MALAWPFSYDMAWIDKLFLSRLFPDEQIPTSDVGLKGSHVLCVALQSLPMGPASTLFLTFTQTCLLSLRLIFSYKRTNTSERVLREKRKLSV